jgi:glycosyltransferase involved in cell wall biosynthesis
MKKIVHICEEFEYMWIGKDNGLIPIYMKEKYGYDSEIWTYNLKNDLPDEIRGVKILKLKEFCPWIRNFIAGVKFIKRLNLYLHLIKNAKDIDVLMLFHMSKSSYWNTLFYKKINPNGKVYIKADFNLEVYKKEIKIIESKSKNLRSFFKKRRYLSEYKKRKKLAEVCDLISYESKESYEYVKDDYAGVSTKGKTIYLPNGIDDSFIRKNMSIKNYDEKEKIFLTVGRLGTYEKNTEAILDALDGMDIKEWKFYLVGKVEKKFQKRIEKFYIENPEKKEKVIFTGPIYDRKVLYSYYNRAKIFVLPSRWESFGIAMVEAMMFGNYILTTPTCAVTDITDNGRIGKIISVDNLRTEICKLLKEEKKLEKNYFATLNHSKKFHWSSLIDKLHKAIK